MTGEEHKLNPELTTRRDLVTEPGNSPTTEPDFQHARIEVTTQTSNDASGQPYLTTEQTTKRKKAFAGTTGTTVTDAATMALSKGPETVQANQTASRVSIVAGVVVSVVLVIVALGAVFVYWKCKVSYSKPD